MLLSIKRWLSAGPADTEWGGLASWAEHQGWDLKRVREVDGFVIDGALDGKAKNLPWRMEWGPSQRDYITGRELRMRIELQLPSEMQMLVLSHPLMETLEKAAYEHFTQTAQTFVDGTAPEEMRWLSMFSKVATADKTLRSGFGVVASEPSWAVSWLMGPLSEQLHLAAAECAVDSLPFLLMTLRGRLYLRLAVDAPDPGLAETMVRLFGAAAQNAHRVAQSFGTPSTNEWPSTAISAWQAQLDAQDSRSDTR